MDIIDRIPNYIIEEENDNLTSIPMEDEIIEEIFNICSDSAAGPDGYNMAFYYSCWDIIEYDIIQFVQALFNENWLTKYYSYTYLVLTPKVEAPVTFSDLRPISLSNVSNKIISKIMSRTLNPLLEKLISNNQSGVVKDRLITENVLLT